MTTRPVIRRVYDLRLAELPDLPAPCRSCLFWEDADARQGPSPDAQSAGVAKEAWWMATQLEWGTPGKAVYDDERLVGYATYAPAGHFPRVRRLGPPPSHDALLLATLWVEPGYERLGLATLLLHSVLRETAGRGAKALEAYGTRSAGGSCLLPEAFLLKAGFAVQREHLRHPLLRLDLRQTVRWQETVGHALENVRVVLNGRERAPAPARASAKRAQRPAAG